MTAVQAIQAVSAIVTALAALGAMGYVRRAAVDARWSRRALEGEKWADAGLIEQVEENEQRSRANTRALQHADLRTDGGHDDE